MYYIGYILGIVLILWLIITLVKALSGKKDKGSDAGPSSADYPSAGGSAGSEGSGIRTAVPGKGSEGGSMPSGEMPSGPMPSAGPALPPERGCVAGNRKTGRKIRDRTGRAL